MTKIRVGQRVKFNSITIQDGIHEKVVEDISLTATGQVADMYGARRMLFTDASKDILPGVREAWLPIEEIDPSEYPKELFAVGVGAEVEIIEDRSSMDLAGRLAYIPETILSLSDASMIVHHLFESEVVKLQYSPLRVLADWRIEDEENSEVIAFCKVEDTYLFLRELHRDDGRFEFMVLSGAEGYREVATEDPPHSGLMSLVMAAYRSDEWGVI